VTPIPEWVGLAAIAALEDAGRVPRNAIEVLSSDVS